MPRKKLSEIDVAGRRVFVRADLDVPLTPARGIADASRLREALPTLRHVLERGARVVLAGHLGSPGGKVDPALSLEPVGSWLAEALGREVMLADEPVGDGARKVVSDLRDGGVALLENLRFAPGEDANDEGFGRALAALADVYVNDAFAASTRALASTAATPKHLPERAAGFLLERETAELGKLLGEVARPYVAVVGGARFSDKLKLLESLVTKADTIYVGGGVGHTLLAARGGKIGRSMIEPDKVLVARGFLRRASERHVSIVLPRDLVAAPGVRSDSGRVVQAGQMPDDLAALDIGPETIQAWQDGVSRARTILWNGPVGAYETGPFGEGTQAIARAIAANLVAYSVVTGDDTTAAVRRAGVADRIGHLSTAAKASLEFLESGKLPGLSALDA